MNYKARQVRFLKNLINKNIDSKVTETNRIERERHRRELRSTAAKLLRIRRTMHSRSEKKYSKQYGRKYYRRNNPKILSDLYETYIKGMRK